MTTKETFRKIADERMEEFYDYLRLQSVSTQHRQIPETVAYVKKMIEKTGGTVQVLDDLGGHPVVYGYFEAASNGNAAKTLLFYNHYDVQPEDPIGEWETEPFEPTVRDGILYARGVADNKANFMVRLNALSALLETEGGLPCNVKFLIEGEEENGSPNLQKYLEKYADLFAADACIWEFGGKDKDERFVIEAGVKGIAYFDVSVESAKVDIHSSMAAVVDNAAWRLVQALATMRTVDNEIVVKGFYDNITPPTSLEKEIVSQLPFNEAATKDIYGLTGDLITKDKEVTPSEALVFEPTLTISGLMSGYTDPGIKTVLPKAAAAKIDCRLVPGQEPEHIYEVLRKHLDDHGFQDVKLELIKGMHAFRSDMTDSFVATVTDSAQKAYGSDTEIVLSPNSAGSGPMYHFYHYLKLPILSSGVGWGNSRAHAPNESIRLADYYQGIEHIAILLNDFAK
ncbi:MAG: M20/M25/M40 family metallo-hydrolase [Carnobacterium sp.]|uniref:M20/M25/M40 family metallo-hydrolase n=1 Tax=Carnobacterium antarcticum TaxID=2126436 RepID=A0ABW4NKD2_9LACT|nr:M20/M25/M40 family metallo-hydrolase [Carnobacterium sp. CP1]ALV22882.1 Acetylornithine deacetylase/Succinyl-diaminopimelate desuccinylase [Carnobacterium sp. CP1]